MDTLQAFALGEMNRGKRMKVFDWHKAVRLIKKNHINNASAGLTEDWNWTGGTILEDGEPYTDNYTFLSSTWATPVLVDDDKEVTFECWCWEDECEWDSETSWPSTALVLMLIGDKK